MASQTKKITLDTAAIFFGRTVGLLLGMVRLNFLARYLGVAGFGILNFATYFCSLFQVLFDFGISQILTRDLSRDQTRSRELVGKALLLKVIIAFFSSLVMGGFAFLSGFDRTTNWAILLTTLTFAINGITMVFLSAFQAHRRMILVSLANILNDLLISIAIILVIQDFPYVVAALIVTAVVSAANLGVLFVVYCKAVGVPEFRADMALWKALLRESAPIAVSTVGISMYMFAGPTVLKYTRGDVEVGVFSAGYKLISILTLIPAAFTQVVFPIFSDFYANAREKLEKALRDSLRVMCLISIPLAAGIIVLTPKIFQILYPPEFEPGMIVLQVIVAANILGYMNWVFYSFLLAVGRQVSLMKISVGVGALHVVGCLLAVPKYGFVAIPLIVAATELTLLGAQLSRVRKCGYDPMLVPSCGKPLVAVAASSALYAILYPTDPFLITVVGALAYAITLYAIRGFGAQEKEMLDKILGMLSGRRGGPLS